MKSYKCPNCGRVYNYGDNVNTTLQCTNCRHILKNIEDVECVKHPELNPMLNNSHVIGTVSNLTKLTPKCPICQSTNLSKISVTKKIAKIMAFGMRDTGKTWKCNNCGSEW